MGGALSLRQVVTEKEKNRHDSQLDHISYSVQVGESWRLKRKKMNFHFYSEPSKNKFDFNWIYLEDTITGFRMRMEIAFSVLYI